MSSGSSEVLEKKRKRKRSAGEIEGPGSTEAQRKQSGLRRSSIGKNGPQEEGTPGTPDGKATKRRKTSQARGQQDGLVSAGKGRRLSTRVGIYAPDHQRTGSGRPGSAAGRRSEAQQPATRSSESNRSQNASRVSSRTSSKSKLPSQASSSKIQTKAQKKEGGRIGASAKPSTQRTNVKGVPKAAEKSKRAPSGSSPSQQQGKSTHKSASRVANTEPSNRASLSTNPSKMVRDNRRKSNSRSPIHTALKSNKEAEINPEDYQHLAAVTRRVSRATIEHKWDGLPSACVDQISQLLQDAQKPVIARLRDEWQQSQASTALQWISRRLVGKISKGLPFPPSIRSRQEDDFDFENILDHNRSLESQLTPTLNANKLLEAELAKEKALLDVESQYLEELEANARKESSKRKQDALKLHSLLQHDTRAAGERDNEIAFVQGEVARRGDVIFDVSQCMLSVKICINHGARCARMTNCSTLCGTYRVTWTVLRAI